MNLLTNVVSELNKAIKSDELESTERIHALTELLNVLTYSHMKNEERIQNFELIQEKCQLTNEDK